MILKPKSCSFPLQRYLCCKNHFRICIHVNGDVNFDKLVHENMFYSVITGFPKSGHIIASMVRLTEGFLTVSILRGVSSEFFYTIGKLLKRALFLD